MMQKDGLPEFTYSSRSSPNFMVAMLGPRKNTIWLQRGFRHYGQPMDGTLQAFKDFVLDKKDSYYETHTDRLCLCSCDHCTSVSPHPVHNCEYKCTERYGGELTEADMRKLGLFQDCHCQCSECILMPAH